MKFPFTPFFPGMCLLLWGTFLKILFPTGLMGNPMQNTLARHPPCRSPFPVFIHLKDPREKRYSVIQPFQFIRDQWVINETSSLLNISLDGFLEFWFSRGSEFKFLDHHLTLRRGSFWIRNPTPFKQFLLVQDVPLVIEPESSGFLALKGKSSFELSAFTGSFTRAKNLQIRQGEETLGKGVRRSPPEQTERLIGEWVEGSEFLCPPAPVYLKEDLENEISAAAKTDQYAQAFFHAWIYQYFFKKLPPDGGLLERGNRALIQKIQEPTSNPSDFLSLAFLYALTEDWSKSIEFVVRGKRAHRGEKGWDFFLAYFRAKAGLKTGEDHLDSQLESGEYPLFSLVDWTLNLDWKNPPLPLFKMAPSDIKNDAGLKMWGVKPLQIVSELFKGELKKNLLKSFRKFWFLNRFDLAGTIGDYLFKMGNGDFPLERSLTYYSLERGLAPQGALYWKGPSTQFSKEENLEIKTRIHLIKGEWLSARKAVEGTLEEFYQPYWVIRYLHILLGLGQFQEIKSWKGKLQDIIKNSPFWTFLELQIAFQEKDQGIIEKNLPEAFKLTRDQIFKLLWTLNRFLSGEKLQSVQLLKKLKEVKGSVEIEIITRHLVDSFLENNRSQVESVFPQVDLLVEEFNW